MGSDIELELRHIGKVLRGKDNPGYLPIPVENRVPEVDRGLPGNPTHLVLADGERSVLKGAPEVGPIGYVQRALEGNGAADHLAVGLGYAEIYIPGVVLQETGEVRAALPPPFGDSRDLRQPREDLLGFQAILLLVYNRKIKDNLRLCRCMPYVPPSFLTGMESSQYGDGDKNQENEEDQPSTNAGKGEQSHLASKGKTL